MSKHPGSPERIDLASADDPRDVIHRVVACLAQGGIVALAGDESQVLVASGLHNSAVERVKEIKGSGPDSLVSIGVRGPSEVEDWAPHISPRALRLTSRTWPGPLTLIVRGIPADGLCAALPAKCRALVAPDSSLAFRMPAHGAFREVRDLVSGPLILADGLGTSDQIALRPESDMVVVHGLPSLTRQDTIVEFDGENWNVLREGEIPEKEIVRGMSMLTLFVCTGNTCRSPMAEALARLILAERLGCRTEDLEARGFAVASAGLAASRGAQAAAEAIEVVHERGGYLHDHVSRQITERMVHGADLIVAMTRDHRDAILDEFPGIEAKVRLLDPDGGDIEDPIGSDLDTYRETAAVIESYLRTLWEDEEPPGTRRTQVSG